MTAIPLYAHERFEAAVQRQTSFRLVASPLRAGIQRPPGVQTTSAVLQKANRNFSLGKAHTSVAERVGCARQHDKRTVTLGRRLVAYTLLHLTDGTCSCVPLPPALARHGGEYPSCVACGCCLSGWLRSLVGSVHGAFRDGSRQRSPLVATDAELNRLRRLCQSAAAWTAAAEALHGH